MAFLCRVLGHRWHGCRCERCGETRDDHHLYEKSDTKCEQTCAVCGKTEKTPHEWHHCACVHCGETRGQAHDWMDTTACMRVCRVCGKENPHHDYKPLERGVDRCARCMKLKYLTPEEVEQRDESWSEPFADEG